MNDSTLSINCEFSLYLLEGGTQWLQLNIKKKNNHQKTIAPNATSKNNISCDSNNEHTETDANHNESMNILDKKQKLPSLQLISLSVSVLSALYGAFQNVDIILKSFLAFIVITFTVFCILKSIYIKRYKLVYGIGIIAIVVLGVLFYTNIQQLCQQHNLVKQNEDICQQYEEAIEKFYEVEFSNEAQKKAQLNRLLAITSDISQDKWEYYARAYSIAIAYYANNNLPLLKENLDLLNDTLDKAKIHSHENIYKYYKSTYLYHIGSYEYFYGSLANSIYYLKDATSILDINRIENDKYSIDLHILQSEIIKTLVFAYSDKFDFKNAHDLILRESVGYSWHESEDEDESDTRSFSVFNLIMIYQNPNRNPVEYSSAFETIKNSTLNPYIKIRIENEFEALTWYFNRNGDVRSTLSCFILRTRLFGLENLTLDDLLILSSIVNNYFDDATLSSKILAFLAISHNSSNTTIDMSFINKLMDDATHGGMNQRNITYQYFSNDLMYEDVKMGDLTNVQLLNKLFSIIIIYKTEIKDTHLQEMEDIINIISERCGKRNWFYNEALMCKIRAYENLGRINDAYDLFDEIIDSIIAYPQTNKPFLKEYVSFCNKHNQKINISEDTYNNYLAQSKYYLDLKNTSAYKSFSAIFDEELKKYEVDVFLE